MGGVPDARSAETQMNGLEDVRFAGHTYALLLASTPTPKRVLSVRDQRIRAAVEGLP